MKNEKDKTDNTDKTDKNSYIFIFYFHYIAQ